jgi:hypothetical protein
MKRVLARIGRQVTSVCPDTDWSVSNRHDARALRHSQSARTRALAHMRTRAHDRAKAQSPLNATRVHINMPFGMPMSVLRYSGEGVALASELEGRQSHHRALHIAGKDSACFREKSFSPHALSSVFRARHAPPSLSHVCARFYASPPCVPLSRSLPLASRCLARILSRTRLRSMDRKCAPGGVL